MTTRQLNTEEALFIRHLLSLANDGRANSELPQTVEVLDDGEMGSIRFSNGQDRKYSKDISAVEYIDTDNRLVLITLTEDNLGDLFELDFWKTDYNKLIIYPTPDKVKRHIDT